MVNDFGRGMDFFVSGFALCMKPGIKRFIFVPLVINSILFIGFSYIAINEFSLLLEQFLGSLPEWLVNISKWFLTIVFGLFLAIVSGYSFAIVANIIAAPFNGLLAEKLEYLLTGKNLPEESVVELVVRSMLRECRKLLYFVPRYIGLLLLTLVLSMIPVVNFLAPVPMLLWSSWSLAIQFFDYPADNHQLGFQEMRELLATQRMTTLGFGGGILLVTMIPLLNLLVMPVAVCGATAYWIDQQKTLQQQG